MKNRMLGVIVPILAGAALIGTGFSTWYFTTNGEQSVNGIETNIATAYKIGDLTLLANGTETVDSSTKFALQIDSTNDTGINLIETSSKNPVKKIDAQYSYTKNDSSDSFTGEDEGTVKLKVTVSLGTNTSKFISLSDEWTNSGSTWTYETSRSNSEDKYTFSVPEFGFTWAKNGSQITSYTGLNGTMEPNSFSEWEQLKVCEGEEITIQYSIDWVEA